VSGVGADFGIAILRSHVHDILGVLGIVGIIIVVLVLAFTIWLNSQRTWGGWRSRGPMG
jgi:uncharacterized protein involved in cysteine biosynthesis